MPAEVTERVMKGLRCCCGQVQVVRELVPSLFRGTYFYETRCQVCKAT